MSGLIQTFEHGSLRELRLSRPPVNALDIGLCRALIAAMDAAVADDVDGVLLSGEGPLFSAGIDVPHLLAHGDDRAALTDGWLGFLGAVRALGHSRVPVAVALTGHVPAGGCVLALCCDYRVMTRSSEPSRPNTIGLNEVRVGLAVPEGIQRLLRRVVGPHTAERMLVTGAMVGEQEALRIGLVDELVDPGLAAAHALDWLQSLQSLPRQPFRQTRMLARADLEQALATEHLDLQRMIDAWYTPDTQAALHALVAKLGRKPA